MHGMVLFYDVLRDVMCGVMWSGVESTSQMCSDMM